jgi:hypothetical protein
MPDVAVRPIVGTAVAIGVVIATVVACVLALLHFGGTSFGGDRLNIGYAAPLAAPDLASAPQDELAKDRGAKRARLDSAGWADRSKGIAHIPIADAMDLLVQQRGGEAKR